MTGATIDPAHVVLRTPRLRLRELHPGDAGFMLELLNDAAFIEHIGDRGVRTREDAERYLANGPLASYAQHGFGLWHVERVADGAALGISGLLRRDLLGDVDLGFAFLPAHRGAGYARESAQAVLGYAHTVLGLDRVVAIVSPGNAASARLLECIGLRFERMIRLGEEAAEIRLFAWQG